MMKDSHENTSPRVRSQRTDSAQVFCGLPASLVAASALCSRCILAWYLPPEARRCGLALI